MTLYLPTERLHGIALPVSFVASEPIEIPRVRPDNGPEAVLAALASAELFDAVMGTFRWNYA
ncbi:hypothetical protein ACWD3I_37335 [Streptomyces sp. NPDC002817]|uniref:hypothetical protein n=1 Tax=Streptomyces sp. NPDC088357 TaxID=3154655 RepID=UPI003432F2CA